MTKDKIRIYPGCCQSAQCGEIQCPKDCRYLPILQEFKAWKETTGAIVEEPIWCPTVYTAQKGEE